MTRTGARAVVIVCVVGLTAGCGSSGGGRGEPRPAGDGGAWTAADASFETAGLQGGPPQGPDITAATSVDGGWAAVGTDTDGSFRAWRSTDGVHWRITKRERGERGSFSVILRRGSDLVAAGSASSGGVIWTSADEGASWNAVRSEALADGSIADATVVGDDVVLVGSTGEGQPRAAAWVMHNASTIEPAVVDDAAKGFMAGVALVGDELVAVGAYAVGGEWRSRDGGAHWTPVPLPGNGQLQSVANVGGRVVAVGEVYGRDDDVPTGYVWLAASPQESLHVLPRHTGSFGDGRAQMGRLLAFRDATVMAGTAADRESPNFCYDDFATCNQHRAVLWLSKDGEMWSRVAVPDTTDSSYEAVATDASGLLVIGKRFRRQDGSRTTRVWRWTGPDGALPSSSVPPEQQYDTPKNELIERYDARLEPGRTYRSVVPVGGPCGAGRLGFNDTRWKVTEPWGEPPYPAAWPVRHEDVSDAPTEYLYGTVRLVDGEHLEVGIEGGSVLRTYAPTDEKLMPCG